MELFSNPDKREAFIGTTVFHVLLLLLFMYLGMPYMVPRPQTGVVVNFGTTDMGSGDVQPTDVGPANTPEPNSNTTPTPVTPTPSESEPVLTDETSDISVPEQTDEQTNDSDETQDTEPEKTQEPEEQQSISDQLSQALERLGQSGGGSEGNTEGQGDMGQEDGTEGPGAYSGSTGNGGNGDYQLGNRGALDKPKVKPDCMEEGVVVMDIVVDKLGKTIRATYSAKGSTTSEACLIEAARKSALQTKWDRAQTGDPVEQRGRIQYRFVLN